MSLSFFFLLIKLNTAVKTAERKINNEVNKNKHLHETLTLIEQEVFKDSSDRKIMKADSVNKRPVYHAVSNTSPLKNKIILKDFSKIHSPSVADSLKAATANTPAKIGMYECKFSNPIRLTATDHIIEVSGVILVKYNVSNQPAEIKAQMKMKENNEDQKNNLSLVSFNCLKAEVKTDNTINCVFKEYDQPKQDEFGFPNHQRNLSMVLSGSLNNSFLDAFIVWDDIAGRPLNAKFKIPVINSK